MQKLYFGGDIVTMEGEGDSVEAVLIENKKIKAAGALAQLTPLCSRRVKKVDLQGRTLMPSFIDPHGHISLAAQVSFMASLNKCTSFAEIVTTLKEYIKERKPKFVMGFGYDHNFLKEGRHPDKDILDQASPELPIFILHTSGHMGCANSAALRLAGIDENTPNPPGGTIGRVAGSQEPSGYLEESAIGKIQQLLIQSIKLNLFRLLAETQQTYLENGITTVQDGATTKKVIRFFQVMAAAGRLKLDVIAYPIMQAGKPVLPDSRRYFRHFRVGGCKLILDGSPQGKTAWMTKPYEGEEDYRGYPALTDEQAEAFIAAAINSNQQLLAHCNGDAAGDQFIKYYKKGLTASINPNKNNLRPVMIHCQTARSDQLDAMAELGMIPSIFVAHTYYWGDVHLKNFGPQRGHKISPAKSALDRGLNITFHQDAPVVPPLMLFTIWCAVNRLTRSGITVGPQERISVYEALQAVTINAAYQYFEEDSKGSIKAGKLADLVILDRNPLKVPAMEIKDIQVLETIKEGRTLYKA